MALNSWPERLGKAWPISCRDAVGIAWLWYTAKLESVWTGGVFVHQQLRDLSSLGYRKEVHGIKQKTNELYSERTRPRLSRNSHHPGSSRDIRETKEWARPLFCFMLLCRGFKYTENMMSCASPMLLTLPRWYTFSLAQKTQAPLPTSPTRIPWGWQIP